MRQISANTFRQVFILLLIVGNKNSGIYHLPQGCPSYSKVAEHNKIHFESEEQAVEAGFRRAGNCR